MNMKRHEYREKVVFVLYQHLLLKNDLAESFSDAFENEFDPFYISLRDDILSNIESYIALISSYLKNWSFDRLNYVDQAILIEAVSEIKSNLNDKAVIIDEAVILSKKYSDEDSFKYINGVLDNL